jgi:hypothetical protein
MLSTTSLSNSILIESSMLSVVVTSIIMLIAVTLSVIMLSAVASENELIHLTKRRIYQVHSCEFLLSKVTRYGRYTYSFFPLSLSLSSSSPLPLSLPLPLSPLSPGASRFFHYHETRPGGPNVIKLFCGRNLRMFVTN